MLSCDCNETLTRGKRFLLFFFIGNVSLGYSDLRQLRLPPENVPLEVGLFRSLVLSLRAGVGHQLADGVQPGTMSRDKEEWKKSPRFRFKQSFVNQRTI